MCVCVCESVFWGSYVCIEWATEKLVVRRRGHSIGIERCVQTIKCEAIFARRNAERTSGSTIHTPQLAQRSNISERRPQIIAYIDNACPLMHLSSIFFWICFTFFFRQEQHEPKSYVLFFCRCSSTLLNDYIESGNTLNWNNRWFSLKRKKTTILLKKRIEKKTKRAQSWYIVWNKRNIDSCKIFEYISISIKTSPKTSSLTNERVSLRVCVCVSRPDRMIEK